MQGLFLLRARFQDRHADQFAEPLGCHWNRDPQELVRRAGLSVLNAQRFLFGVFHVIEAKPRALSILVDSAVHDGMATGES